VIKPVSADSLRKKGNIRGHSRRLSAISASRPANRESGDRIEYGKNPDFRPVSVSLGKPSRMPDCLAGDAVLIAPVSGLIPC
jgi:hypothetical protein